MSSKVKLRVDKKRFLEAVAYIKQVNSVELENLDLSEFFTGNLHFQEEVEGKGITHRSMPLHEAIEWWRMVGLDNRDFILFFNKEGIKKNGF